MAEPPIAARTEASAGTAALLRLDRVSKNYGEHVITHALRDVDLRIQRGEFIAITGPSGSGKTTLLNLIGLLDRPTAGQILLDGQDTSSLPDDARTRIRAHKIGFVFQFHHLLPAFSALENVMLPMMADRGRADPAMRERAARLLADVDLTDRAHYRAVDLSGGQQQRVAVARALVMDPPLVLADEPTGNLDTQAREQVFGLLRRFCASRGTAFLIVTHEDRLASRCDRVVHMVDGRIDSDRTTG